MERRKLRELAVLAMLADAEPGPHAEEEVVDDRLRLIFTCCHPALSLEARVALTLRTVAGVPTGDIARAFAGQRVDHDPAAHPGQDEDRGRRASRTGCRPARR